MSKIVYKNALNTDLQINVFAAFLSAKINLMCENVKVFHIFHFEESPNTAASVDFERQKKQGQIHDPA